ncbi:MAG TPA: hypothetical protein VJ547_12200 [Candidatus Thermoplasmatota archaeon]|nr:hypothetical protein [Candidatus Thermoplasmatota archaeon]
MATTLPRGDFLRAIATKEFDISGGGSFVEVAYTAFGNTYRGLRALNGLDRSARHSAGRFPANIDTTSAPRVAFQWLAPSTAIAGNVRLQFDAAARADAAAFSSAAVYDFTATADMPIVATAAGEIAPEDVIFTLPLALAVANSVLLIRISRLGADAADTYGAPVILTNAATLFRRLVL